MLLHGIEKIKPNRSVLCLIKYPLNRSTYFCTTTKGASTFQHIINRRSKTYKNEKSEVKNNK